MLEAGFDRLCHCPQGKYERGQRQRGRAEVDKGVQYIFGAKELIILGASLARIRQAKLKRGRGGTDVCGRHTAVGNS